MAARREAMFPEVGCRPPTEEEMLIMEQMFSDLKTEVDPNTINSMFPEDGIYPEDAFTNEPVQDGATALHMRDMDVSHQKTTKLSPDEEICISINQRSKEARIEYERFLRFKENAKHVAFLKQGGLGRKEMLPILATQIPLLAELVPTKVGKYPHIKFLQELQKLQNKCGNCGHVMKDWGFYDNTNKEGMSTIEQFEKDTRHVSTVIIQAKVNHYTRRDPTTSWFLFHKLLKDVNGALKKLKRDYQ